MEKKMNDSIKDGIEEQASPAEDAEVKSDERQSPEAEVTAANQPTETQEDVVRDLDSFDDTFIEAVSVENNIEEVCKHTRLSSVPVKYLMGIVYIVLGAVCAAIPGYIEAVLPYIVGGLMGLFSIVRFIFAMIDKEYKYTYSNKTASSVILLGVSIMIIIEHEWAHSFIPTVWGVWGLIEGAHAFNQALSRISKHRKFLFYLFKGIVEVVVAFLLLYKPDTYGELHIIVFGISLILDGIVALPPVHKFLTRG